MQASNSHSIVSPLPSPSPTTVHSGESIYRIIMNRLSALEANTTLYAHCVDADDCHARAVPDRVFERDSVSDDGLMSVSEGLL
jgi:hypothetical protein